MKAIVYDKIIHARDDNFKLLYDFMDSGIKCAKVEGYTNSSPTSYMASLSKCAKVNHLYSAKVCVRNGEVYLVNTSID